RPAPRRPTPATGTSRGPAPVPVAPPPTDLAARLTERALGRSGLRCQPGVRFARGLSWAFRLFAHVEALAGGWPPLAPFWERYKCFMGKVFPSAWLVLGWPKSAFQ